MAAPHRPLGLPNILASLAAWVVLSSTWCSAFAQEPDPAEPAAPGPPAPARVAPETLAPAASCIEAGCHDDLTVGVSVHPAAKAGECEICHEADGDKHAFELPFEGTDLCFACHDDVTDKEFLHDPLELELDGCMFCHDPHVGKADFLLKTSSVEKACLKCHDDVSEGAPLHTAEKTDSCVSCHDPHSADHEKFLRAAPPDVCYTCHDTVQASVEEAEVVHGPMALGCGACHDPHTTRAGGGLKKVGADVCTQCHDHFLPTVADMAEHHSLLLEGEGCLQCHDPHGAEEDLLLKDTSVELCLSCHNKDITRADGSVVARMQDMKTEGAALHGPLKDGQCTGCHMPHGNDSPGFLQAAYPGKFYAPYSEAAYALCFQCHDEAVAARRRTTEDTEFRNGDLNLHHVHVNKAQKGRTCRACHVAHASTADHFLAKEVPFGQWSLPVGFTATENGGTCASGCHQPKSYDRVAPVAYKVPAPDAGRADAEPEPAPAPPEPDEPAAEAPPGEAADEAETPAAAE